MKKIKELDIKKLYSWGIFLLAVLNIIVFIFIANKIYFRMDLTEGQKYSISKPSVDILKNLQDQLVIEYYYNDKSKELSEMALVIQYVVDMLKEYESASKGKVNVIIRELNFEKNAGDIADLESQGLQTFALSESGKAESKSLLGLSGIIVKYKGQQRSIPTVYSDVGFEFRLDVEIKKLTGTGSEGGVGVLMSSKGKTLDKDYKYVEQVISKEYNDVRIINPGDGIPKDIGTLVLIGGDDLTDYDLFGIDQFFMNGGKAFVALNGIDVAISQYGIYATPKDNKLMQLLAYYGIRVNKDLIGDNDSYTPLPQRNGIFVQQNRYPIWPKIKSNNFNSKNPIVNDMENLNLFWASSISIDDRVKSNAEWLFKTTKSSWAQQGDYKLDIETYKYPVQEGAKEFEMAYVFEGEVASFFKDQPVPKNDKNPQETYTGTRYDNGKTKIIIIGNEFFIDSNFAGNDELLLLMNGIDALSKDTSLIQIRNKGKFSKPLYKAKNQLQHDTYKNIIIGFTTYFIPLLFIILAVVLNFRRKLINKKIKDSFVKSSN
ncbi:MAG TPA: GldG family protein [Spirochaetota bacterium]|nr:GldG family protein [Spirochaetota bacterium]